VQGSAANSRNSLENVANKKNMYWPSAFIAFLAGVIIATAGIYWYRHRHPRYDPAARVRWLNSFDFERAGHTLIGLGVVVFFSQYLLPTLGIVAGLLLGARAALAAMQRRSYNLDSIGAKTVYIE
jgi:hypothetical protein